MTILLSKESVDAEEEHIRLQVRQLSEEQKKHYYQLERTRVKDPDNYAVLNWFVVTGLHHFYLKRLLRGVINLSLLLVGVLILIFMPEPYKIWGVGVWAFTVLIELPQLFNAQNIVKDYNNKVMLDCLRLARQSEE